MLKFENQIVRVTPEHIAMGDMDSLNRSPVALAINDVDDCYKSRVDSAMIEFHHNGRIYCASSPGIVSQFILKGSPLETFEFMLEPFMSIEEYHNGHRSW